MFNESGWAPYLATPSAFVGFPAPKRVDTDTREALSVVAARKTALALPVERNERGRHLYRHLFHFDPAYDDASDRPGETFLTGLIKPLKHLTVLQLVSPHAESSLVEDLLSHCWFVGTGAYKSWSVTRGTFFRVPETNKHTHTHLIASTSGRVCSMRKYKCTFKLESIFGLFFQRFRLIVIKYIYWSCYHSRWSINLPFSFI